MSLQTSSALRERLCEAGRRSRTPTRSPSESDCRLAWRWSSSCPTRSMSTSTRRSTVETDRGTLHVEFDGRCTFTPTGGAADVVAEAETHHQCNGSPLRQAGSRRDRRQHRPGDARNLQAAQQARQCRRPSPSRRGRAGRPGDTGRRGTVCYPRPGRCHLLRGGGRQDSRQRSAAVIFRSVPSVQTGSPTTATSQARRHRPKLP